MAVPFIDIKRFEPGFLEKWETKVKELSAVAQFIGGAEVAELEKRLSEFTETKYAVACANGTDALQLALRAMGVGRGDTVLVPDSTFWATFEAVVNVGADPVTVDTNEVDLQMDFEEFKKAAEKYKPKAAILVHLYGWASAKVLEYRKFCNEKGVLLLEDGAQCFGVRIQNESIYKSALISTTSFYPAKVLGAAGDGGAVFTNDEALATMVRQLANHGRTSHYGHGSIGWNSRMDSLQAAFLNLSLDHIQARLDSRISIAKRYQKELPALGINVIEPPTGFTENGYCNANIFSLETRPKLEAHLKEKGIAFGIIYPGAMSDQPGAAGYGKFGDKNIARKICASILNLPLFAYMNDQEFDEVYSALKDFFK
ncbi:DegT/DnrJ/EryC1/StrS family aminotransferase [Leptospira sp. GIMC2001]|uniref:DegT/DnrJ/EryC1/StrS family aminotransferase n=1 Tax=Leptospira sp. GIMC2001 TaxID=1513297 RepID=UPI0023493B78|nr:DegT/DnrJ/EryC1/StrS family aminotransferase [Leptospira sp. GIMC2001]WCL50521.1 DegT/DnrJ/EryC1/StrS family aminotransferase [Leptospira sp. GIMC2001]